MQERNEKLNQDNAIQLFSRGNEKKNSQQRLPSIRVGRKFQFKRLPCEKCYSIQRRMLF